MSPRGTTKALTEGVKEHSPLLQLITVLVLAIVLVVQQQGVNAGQTERQAADKGEVDIQLAQIQKTLDQIDSKIDPLTREVMALKLRVGTLEQTLGRGDQ